MSNISFYITQDEINLYAQISNDYNPIHLDEELAKSHGFPNTIAHGMLTMAKAWSVISGNLLTPTDFPEDYELEFPSPVHANDVIVLQVEQLGNRMKVIGTCNDQVVIKGFFIKGLQ